MGEADRWRNERKVVGSLEIYGPPSVADHQKITETAGVLVSRVWLDEHKTSR